MVDDLSDPYSADRRQYRATRRAQRGNRLESGSVTNGRVRFVGGLLLIDSGGRLEIVGRMNGTGEFEWSGPWKFDSGNGEIAGDVDLTGILRLLGTLSVATGGSIEVGDVVLSEADGGSLAAPLRIVINTPLTDLLGGLKVAQGAVFEGGITASGLMPIAIADAPAGAFQGAIFRDSLDRFRVVT